MSRPILFVCLMALSQTLTAQAPDNAVVGTWRLLSIRDPADSTRYYKRWGPRPSGLLVYSPNGTVAIQIVADPRPTVSATNRDQLTGDEALRAMRAYYAYFGRYTVESGERFQWPGPVLVQQVESSVWPFEGGREYVRPYARSGDTLVLRAWQGTGWSIQRWLRVSDR